MPLYEYKIVPAPEKAEKIKGLKSPARFVATVEALMNEMGAEGWQYLRAETLTQEERSGLTGKARTDRNLLIFQRELEEFAVEQPAPPTFSKAATEPPLTREDPASLEDVFEIGEPTTPPPTDPSFSR